MPAKRELSMRQLRHFWRASPRWGERARDRATSWRGALDDPGQSEAGGGGRAGMAAGRRRHRKALETRLFGRAGVTQGQRRRAEPDWAALARELKRPGVTMSILWEEYREVHPEGYGYSRFCDLLHESRGD